MRRHSGASGTGAARDRFRRRLVLLLILLSVQYGFVVFLSVRISPSPLGLTSNDEPNRNNIESSCNRTIFEKSGLPAQWFHRGRSYASTVIVQWIDSIDALHKMIDQWQQIDGLLVIIASTECTILQEAHESLSVPVLAASSLNEAFSSMASSPMLQNDPQARILGWFAAPLIVDGYVQSTLVALEQYSDDQPWIAAGRVNVSANEVDAPSIFYPPTDSEVNHRDLPEGEIIFPYPFSTYLPDWFLPFVFMNIKHAHRFSDSLIGNNLHATVKMFNLIDITMTFRTRIATGTSLQSLQGKLPAANRRLMLRQATMATAMSAQKIVKISPALWPPKHVLEEVAPLGTVIVSSTNCGFLDFAQNWLLSIFRLADADMYSNSILLIAEDERSFVGLERIIPGRVVLPPSTVREELHVVDYNDHGCDKLVSSQPLYLIKLHEQGYTFLWSDLDAVWNRNPIPKLLSLPYDYVGQSDSKPPTKPIDGLCTCFLFMRSGNPVLTALLHLWYDAVKDSQSPNQGPFNDLLRPIRSMVNMTILEPLEQYPPGWRYFEDPQWYRKNMQPEPVVIHNNWISGKSAKQKRFESIGRWSVAQHRHAIASCQKPESSYSWNVWEAVQPPKRFQPLPNDTVGVPNVLFGCNKEAHRQVDEIQIHVIGWDRRECMETLLLQLAESDYEGWHKDVPLCIHLDGGQRAAAAKVYDVAMHFKWPHGEKQVQIQPDNVGLRSMYLNSIGPVAKQAGNNTLLVVFEDDTRVSPAYFQWLLKLIDQYGRQPQCRDSNLVGFSLTPLLLQEMSKPYHPWDAREAMGERNKRDHRHLVYLSAVPNSWGTAYWSDQWNSFDKFVRLRMEPPFYDVEAENVKVKDYAELKMSPPELHVPGARSNVWPKSWKRFMVDFMYARGLVMLYPNLPRQEGLATTLHETGVHVGKKKTTTRDPRVANLLEHLDLQSMGILPRYGDLAVFNLTLQLTTREELAMQGGRFLQGVLDKCAHCGELVQLWARPGVKLLPPSKVTRTTNTADTHTKNNTINIRSPPTCVADLYTSVSAAALRPPLSSAKNEKYLLYEPQYGADNQLQAVIEAYYWARALNRRLVLPPAMMPRVSAYQVEDPNAEWIQLEKFFDVSDQHNNLDLLFPAAAKFDQPALELVGYTEFSTWNKAPWRLLRVTRDAYFDASARVLTTSLHKQDIEIVNLRHLFSKPVPIDMVQHYLGGCDDEVLAFDGLFFANLVGVDRALIMPDVMQMRPEVTELYTAVQKKLAEYMGTTEYACYHVRLGDFESMCKAVENPHHNSLRLSGYSKLPPRFACSVSPHELSYEIERNGYPAFVMSDSPSELQNTLSRVPQQTVTSDWVSSAVRESLNREVTDSELQFYSLLVDQSLCSDAQISVLNRFSTVSQRVVSLRRGQGYKYWRRRQELSIFF